MGTGLEHIRLGRHFTHASTDIMEYDARFGASYEHARSLDTRSERRDMLNLCSQKIEPKSTNSKGYPRAMVWDCDEGFAWKAPVLIIHERSI